MNLRDYIESFLEAEGVTRLIVMTQIRSHMDRLTILEAITEIETLTTEKEFNILVGIGLKGILYHKAIAHKARLEGLI